VRLKATNQRKGRSIATISCFSGSCSAIAPRLCLLSRSTAYIFVGVQRSTHIAEAVNLPLTMIKLNAKQ